MWFLQFCVGVYSLEVIKLKGGFNAYTVKT
jgi:hypothetical protein